MSKLNIINFSDGIRSEEIQENFELLESEVKRERLGVGGTGIASGLEIKQIISDEQFAIKVSEASIVDTNGDDIHIETSVLDVERPRLFEIKERVKADINNQVVLTHTPYMLNGICPVQYGDSLSEIYTGISAKYQDSPSTDDFIRVKAVNGKTLTLTGLIRRDIEVTYYYTAKRIDTVYIDNDYNIKIKSSSITSTTPSVVYPDSYKYLIAFILIDPMYTETEQDAPHSYITIKKDLRSTRNLYTDDGGTLHICGIPFNDLHLLTTDKPANPKPNQVYIDPVSATMYLYKSVDKYTYKKTYELTSEHDIDNFNDFETDITFLIDSGELKVMVNSLELKEGEYDELFDGIPTSIQSIPKNTPSNRFRIYKRLKAGDILTYTITISESGYRWIPINKQSYVNTKECKEYGVSPAWRDNNYWTSPQALALGNAEDGYANKYKYFIFDAERDRNMIFNPGANETEVLVNQLPLHRDQYVELSVDMIPILPANIRDAIYNTYGWTEEKLSTMNAIYDELGIGIILKDSLDSIYNEGVIGADNNAILEEELFVEININRAVSDVTYNRKLQRTASFVYENTIVVEDSSNKKIKIEDAAYRYGENQLDIFLNGTRLVCDRDYKEGTDLYDNINSNDVINNSEIVTGNPHISYKYRTRGAISREFEITRTIVPGDVIDYKITTTFLSYDHINSLLDNIETKQEMNDAKITALYESSMKLNQDTAAMIEDVKNKVNNTASSLDNINNILTTDSVIGEDNLDANLIKRIPQSRDHICHVITFGSYDQIGYDLTNYIREDDFLLVWHRSIDNMNIDRMLIPDLDYTIQSDYTGDGNVTVYFRLTNDALSQMQTRDKIIIRGIKFGREGR